MALYIGSASPWADIGGLNSPGEKQKHWPPTDEIPRLATYSRNFKLYYNKHKEVYVDVDGYTYDDDRPYVAMNILAETTNLITDRLLGEGFEIILPDESKEWLEHVTNYNKFDNQLRDAAVGSSYRGDGVIQVGFDHTTNEIVFSPVSASNFYLYASPNVNKGKVLEQMIAWVITKTDSLGSETNYLFQEIHIPGTIFYYLYKLYGTYKAGSYSYNPTKDRIPLNTLPEFADLPDEVMTGVDTFLCTHIALGGSDDTGLFGKSDYLNTDSMQGELNNRVNQLAEVLDKTQNPYFYGPEELLDEFGELSNDNRYIGISSGENIPIPGYIEFNGELDASYQEINELKRSIVFSAGLSPSSFGFEQDDTPESGIAIKRRQMRTQSKVQLRQKNFTYFIQNIISVASKLTNSPEISGFVGPNTPILETADISVIWADGIPQSVMEMLAEEELALSLGLTSRKTAMKRIYQYEDAALDEELANIDAERSMEHKNIEANKKEVINE